MISPMSRMQSALWALGLLAQLVAFDGLQAQVDPGRAVITGTIRANADSAPLKGVDVYIVGSQERTRTDGKGRFRFTGIYPGRYEVRARMVGYEQLVKLVTVAGGETNDNAWEMTRLSQQLTEVRVLGNVVQVPATLREPYRRAAHLCAGVAGGRVGHSDRRGEDDRGPYRRAVASSHR